MCHVPFRWLVLGFVFSVLAFEVKLGLEMIIIWYISALKDLLSSLFVSLQTSLGNFALFCSHAAGLGAQFEHLLLVLLVRCNLLKCFSGCSYRFQSTHWSHNPKRKCKLNMHTSITSADLSLNSRSSLANSSSKNWKKGHSVHRTDGESWGLFSSPWTPLLPTRPVYVSLSSSSLQQS